MAALVWGGTALGQPTPTVGSAQLDWSTYLGGATPAPTRIALPQRGVSPQDTARDVATDSQGNIYVVGGTASLDFPRTLGPAHAGDMDVFIAKFAPDGTLLWSRLVGGPNYDRAYGVQVKSDDSEIVICGRGGPNLPTQACASCGGHVFQPTFNGDNFAGPEYGQQDGWVGKVDASGNLLWLSYFGDTASDLVRDCDIDVQGDVYVGHHGKSGQTPSLGTPGSFRPTSCGGTGTDMVIGKLDRDGKGVIWAGYLCGTAQDDAPSIRVAPDGTVYVASDTESSDFPLVNAVQTTLTGGRDFILTRIAADGSALLFSTLLGGHNGSGTEFTGTHNLGIDGAGNAYLCAETDATDFPGTTGFFQPTNAGGTDHIFAKVKVTPPTALLAATYVGGPGKDGEMQGCVVDAAGNVVATALSAGSGSSYPTTTGALQNDNAGGNDAVLVQLASDFKSLRYATYLGGSGDDQGRSATVTKSGLVVVGMTQSTNFHVLNALQSRHAENPIVDYDGFVAKFSLPTPIATSSPPATSTTTYTPTLTATLTSPTFTVTATSTHAILPSPTSTPSATPSRTLTLTPTRTNTVVPSSTPTPSATPSPTLTVSLTPAPTHTQAPTGTTSAPPTATTNDSATATPNAATETATPPFSPTATVVPSLTATFDTGPVRGDLDGDGKVSDADLRALIKALFVPNPLSAADVNVDGRVSAADVAALAGAL